MLFKKIEARDYSLPIKYIVECCSEIRTYLKNNNYKIDLGNSSALQIYNSCLYKVLEDLEISVPSGHLIPTAGLRRAIVDIILTELKPRPKKVIEIGTGATAIMALLLASKGISLLATEIDPDSYTLASQIIERNRHKVLDRIVLALSTGGAVNWVFDHYKAFFPVDGILALPPFYENSPQELSMSRGFQGTYSELYTKFGPESLAVQVLVEAQALYPAIKCTILLWKNETSLKKGFSYGKGVKDCSNIYEIKAGTRTRYLSVSLFS